MPERTPKRWKALQASGFVLIIAGAALITTTRWGLFIAAAGLALLLIGGILAWWFHG